MKCLKMTCSKSIQLLEDMNLRQGTLSKSDYEIIEVIIFKKEKCNIRKMKKQ